MKRRTEEVGLSPAQRAALERASRTADGVITKVSTSGLGYASWDRMMKRLCGLGLMKPYVHGGFEITRAGRLVLADDPGGIGEVAE